MPNDSFRPRPVDANTVILTIKHLKSTNSAGTDGITLRFLKDSLTVTISYLTTIINTSIVTGKFPSAWKQATVIPIYKSGDRNSVSNYRPISLLPVLSKVLEKIVANQLSAFLESKHLLSNSQHGFRPKLSTETALTTIASHLYENMDNKKISLVTLCDLSKAFDSVHHGMLIEKLTQLGIDSFWFQNYLSDRCQNVKINKTVSKTANINFGVPQGSTLGPILFTIFVNDLANEIRDCTVVQYADDTQFLHTGTVETLPDLVARAERTLSQARTYFNTNGLVLNPSKTQCIFIGNRQLINQIPNNTTIRSDTTSITPSKQVKNLGIYLDSHMTFETHIRELSKKVMGTLLLLNRVKEKFDTDTRRTVVQSLALSVINYCLPVYGTTNATLLRRVQSLQNFPAKICVEGAKRSDHATPIIRQLEWLKFDKKLMFDVAITVFKIRNNTLPAWFMRLPTNNEVLHGRFTRQLNNLHVPRHNTDCGGRSLHILGPKVWNSLPSHITNSGSLPSFKAKLKQYLINTDTNA